MSAVERTGSGDGVGNGVATAVTVTTGVGVFTGGGAEGVTAAVGVGTLVGVAVGETFATGVSAGSVCAGRPPEAQATRAIETASPSSHVATRLE